MYIYSVLQLPQWLFYCKIKYHTIGLNVVVVVASVFPNVNTTFVPPDTAHDTNVGLGEAGKASVPPKSSTPPIIIPDVSGIRVF